MTVHVQRNAKLETVICQSQYGPCSIEITELLNSYVGKNVLTSYLNIGDALREHNHVVSAVVKFDGLNSLRITTIQRKAQVAIQAVGDSNYYLYSSDGYGISVETETQLPVVILKDNSIVTRDQEQFVIRMAHVLNETYNVKQIEVVDSGLQFKKDNSPQVIFPLSGDEDILLGSLTFVLSQLNTQVEGLTMESILDFRFRNPIIRTYE